jgi:hypothetical protein
LTLVIVKNMGIRIGGRGTSSRKTTGKEEDNWAGSPFKKYSEQQKDAAKDRYITMGRGTAKIKFGDVASTEAKPTKGMWVRTGRGTGRRKID